MAGPDGIAPEVTGRADSFRDETDELTVLLLRCFDGDRASLREIYDRQAPRLRALAIRITGDGMLADDVLHDVFVRLMVAPHRFDRERGSGAAFLTMVTRFAAMEMMPQDAEVTALVNRMFRRMQDLFAACVIRGQLSGEIPRDRDERTIARLMVCTIQGLRVLGKTGPSETELTDMVDLALRVLD